MRRAGRYLSVAVVCLAMCAASGAAEGTTLTGRASVIDGDTIEIHGQRVRIAGIDAVERDQLCWQAQGRTWRCGQVAALALSDLIGSHPVLCTTTGQDKFGRIVGSCSVRGADLGAYMVSEGHAIPYFDRSDHYGKAVDHAREGRKGMWSGSFATPSDWRKQRVP